MGRDVGYLVISLAVILHSVRNDLWGQSLLLDIRLCVDLINPSLSTESMLVLHEIAGCVSWIIALLCKMSIAYSSDYGIALQVVWLTSVDVKSWVLIL